MAEQPCIVYYTKDPLLHPTTVEDGPFHPSMDPDTPSPSRSHRVELTSALIPWIVEKRRLYERGLFGGPLPPQWTTAPLSILDIYRPLQRDKEQWFGQVVRLLEHKKRVQEETAEALGYHVVDAGTAYEQRTSLPASPPYLDDWPSPSSSPAPTSPRIANAADSTDKLISDLELGEPSVGQLKAGVTRASADNERVRLGALGELCMREGAADRPPTRPDVVKCSFQPTVPSLPGNCFKARGGRRSSTFGRREEVGAGEGSW